jgi:hypothetical protein
MRTERPYAFETDNPGQAGSSPILLNTLKNAIVDSTLHCLAWLRGFVFPFRCAARTSIIRRDFAR